MKKRLESALPKRLSRLFGGSKRDSDEGSSSNKPVVPSSTPAGPLRAPSLPNPLNRRSNTTNAAPVTVNFEAAKPNSKPSVTSSVAPQVDFSLVALDSLDDFSLIRLIDRRLFSVATSEFKDVVFAARLAPIHAASQQQSALGKVLAANKSDDKRRECLLAVTSVPDLEVHGIVTTLTSTLAIAWTFPIKNLLAIREIRRGVVVLQFAGGKERKLLPASETEKAWVLYCLARFGKEICGGEVTVVGSTKQPDLGKDALKTRCPYLANIEPSLGVSEVGQVSFAKPLGLDSTSEVSMELLRDGEEDFNSADNDVDVSLPTIEKTDLLLVERVLNGTQEVPIKALEKTLEDLRAETYQELRDWEAGVGSQKQNAKRNYGLDSNRQGDAIASLVAQLEQVEQKLGGLDEWMNTQDASILRMTSTAKRIDSEVKQIREELSAKDKLAEHMREILEDLSSEQAAFINKIPDSLQNVQREVESSNLTSSNYHPLTDKICDVLSTLAELLGKDKDESSKLLARRVRSKKLKELTRFAGASCRDFLIGRVEYYYRFERVDDARETHTRLMGYLPIIAKLRPLVPEEASQIEQSYIAEASQYLNGQLRACVSHNVLQVGNQTQWDTMAKLNDSTLNQAEYEREMQSLKKSIQTTTKEFRTSLMKLLTQELLLEHEFSARMGFTITKLVADFSDQLASGILPKAIHYPLSFAYPVYCDVDRLVRGWEKDPNSAPLGKILREKLHIKLRDAVDRFLVEHASSYFDKTKRSTPSLFVKKFPALLDRLQLPEETEDEASSASLVAGISSKPLTENVVQLIGALTNPFHRLENLYFLYQSLLLRERTELIQALEVKAKYQAAIKATAYILIRESDFKLLFELANRQGDAPTFGQVEIEDALRSLQNGLARASSHIKGAVDAKLQPPGLRTILKEVIQTELTDAHWKVSEQATDLGIACEPSMSTLKRSLTPGSVGSSE